METTEQPDTLANPGVNLQALGLLLDVELPVSVSFGRVSRSLQDVLSLSVGSSIDLGRAVGDPVDILVNGAVFARGELVVVDGNYGVRILETCGRPTPEADAADAARPAKERSDMEKAE